MNMISVIHSAACTAVYYSALVVDSPVEDLTLKAIELGLGGLVIYLVTKPLLSHVISYQNGQSAEIAKLTALLASAIAALQASHQQPDNSEVKRLLGEIADHTSKLAKRTGRSKNTQISEEQP